MTPEDYEDWLDLMGRGENKPALAPMKLKRWKDGDRSAGYSYWCQGCESHHTVRTQSSVGGSVWGFNDNLERPTFNPSVLVRYEAVPNADPVQFPEWLNERICHTFITDGMVQFLSDCTHALAGQTLPLPNLPRSEGAPE